MTEFLGYLVIGIVSGAVYAIAASGLVVTYTTSGVFNFGHGAVGMVVAFAYWELSINRGIPTWLALILTLFVLAPLMGILLERVLFRRLAGDDVAVSLVVTVGLLVLFLGIGQTIWPGDRTRVLPEFFEGSRITVVGINVTYHQLITILIGVAVAVGLRILLFQTRLGVGMRAVVDNRELAAQNGILPERAAAAAWAIGIVLAGVSGLLLAPALTLDHIVLTLLVINGYAAAILGQLRSLPLTYAGGMVLGIGQALIVGYATKLDFGRGWIGANSFFSEFHSILPIVFLFLVLVFLPQARLRVGRIVGASNPRVPQLIPSVRNAVIFVVVISIAGLTLEGPRLLDATAGLTFGMVMCSLVLLSGYGGQISLCQFSFAGVGALVVAKGFAGGPLWAVLVAGVVAAAVGAIVAIPALRLQDLYLALTTFSVALLLDETVFAHPDTFDGGASVFLDDFNLGPIDLSSDRAGFVVAAIGFAIFGVIVLAIRRSPFGRRLSAMSDSPAAAATLGMSILGTKVAVFALSAGMAGIAGGLFAYTQGAAGATDFNAVRSLFIFLLATIGGLTSVTGAFIGGIALPLLTVVQDEILETSIELQGLFIGGGAILISRVPNGVAGYLFALADRFRRPSDRTIPPDAPAAVDAPAEPVAV